MLWAYSLAARARQGQFLLFALVLAWATSSLAGEKVSFNRDIRPILSENCFFCHGFDKEKREADLRLDIAEGALADLGGYAAVVPGEPEDSEIIARVTSDDPDLVMPPHDSPYKLTAEEAETLRRWIAQGAEYEEHWAYTPLERPVPPNPEEAASPNPVDAFLEARWTEEGVAPSQVADPRTLARRLSFDLTGLPPSQGAVDAFESDPSDRHFEAMVDRLLATNAYAEHLATWWLDLVRWSDTSGMASDEPIDTQAYRAYVVRALRENKPFDRFTIEQLAGDLLENPTDDSLIASGYNRLVRTNSEAGVIPTEALYAMKVDHVSALGTVWLGSTTACAQCHDHKYDPFTQRDFYRLAAYFDDLVETGVYSPGDRRVPLHYAFHDETARTRAAKIKERLAALREELLRADQTLDAGQGEWEQQQLVALESPKLLDFAWMPARLPATYVSVGRDYEDVDLEGQAARRQSAATGELSRHGVAEPLTGFLDHSVIKKGTLYANVYLDPENPPQAIAIQLVQGGYGRMGWRPNIYGTLYWGPEGAFGDASWVHKPKHRRVGDLPDTGAWVRLEVPFTETFPLVGGAYRHMGMAWAQQGGVAYWGDSGLRLPTKVTTELALGATSFRRLEQQPINRDDYEKKLTLVAKALRTAAADRDETQLGDIRQAYREAAQPVLQAEVLASESELYRLREEHATPALVSRAGPRKVTHVVARGDFRTPLGDPLSPGVPEFLSGGSLGDAEPGGGAPPTRLDLAEWLVSEDNPLTARVFVNRLWAEFFGRGLCSTLEDVGGQGEWPTHPELLDWLAADFVESGWDIKHLVKQIVMTRPYRLDSHAAPELHEHDPENKLLTRQRRLRFRAEVIRDNALAVSGLLKTGYDSLESIWIYQPDTYWDGTNKVMLGSRFLDYRASGTDRQHVRTLYAFWKRIGTHPTLLAFDAPSRQSCTAHRSKTNTPGQALVLLNDPVFVEAARVLAERVLLEGIDPVDSPEAVTSRRIDAAYSRVLQRPPSGEEKAYLQAYLKGQLEHFAARPEKATELVSIGCTPVAVGIDTTEHAAWTSVCRVLLNLHETIVRQ